MLKRDLLLAIADCRPDLAPEAIKLLKALGPNDEFPPAFSLANLGRFGRFCSVAINTGRYSFEVETELMRHAVRGRPQGW